MRESDNRSFWIDPIDKTNADSSLPNGAGNPIIEAGSPCNDSEIVHVSEAEPNSVCHILVGEDVPATQELLRIQLRRKGLDVTIVSNGRQVVEQALCRRYDLIILDIQMPEVDGLEASRMIRRSGSACADTPILGMSANVDPRLRHRCMEAGMQELLSKPIRRAELLQQVQKWFISPVEEKGKSEGPVFEKKEATETAVPLDLAAAIGEFGSIEKVAEISRIFMEDAGQTMDSMQEAFHQGDLERIRHEAHALKGGAATLEAAVLAEAAGRLEDQAEGGNWQEMCQVLEQLQGEYKRLRDFLSREFKEGRLV